ncbi:SET domain-containing protein [Dentipellis sp. KUC8613]|nr:SET domain-containing protein [Dentipellis sp. KUC8613]
MASQVAQVSTATKSMRYCNQILKRVVILVAPLIIAALALSFRDGRWDNLKVSRTSSNDDAVHADVKSPSFVVQSLTGKGKGLIATRNIQRGELLIREAPLFIVPHTVSSSPAELILNMVRGLSPEQSEAFYNLSYVHLHPGLRPEVRAANVPLAIFQTNAVAAGSGVGLFPNMARLNHGCSFAFNVVYSWREDKGVLMVYALKDIRKGEELLTTYTDTKRSRDERRDFLKQTYDFECTCACCALGPEESQASDGRLSRMRELYQRLASWGHGGIDGKEAIRIVREIWAVGSAEGYTSERGQLAADAATVACAHADARAGREWARKAEKWGRIELGAESVLVSSALETAASPWGHRMWGTRGEMTVGGPIEP